MKMIMVSWARRRFLSPISKAIKQGISAEKLSVSLAIGITVGLIPIYGVTTLLIGIIAVSLKLNMIIAQVAHYIVHPLQIALIVPFLKLGDALLKGAEMTFSVKQYFHLFRTDFWGTLQEIWLINLSAIGIWLVMSIPLFVILYYTLFYFIRKYSLKLKLLRA